MTTEKVILVVAVAAMLTLPASTIGMLVVVAIKLWG